MFDIINFGKVESTNKLAFKLIEEGRISRNSIIIADSQISGRGRHDRVWESPEGNLYMSLVMRLQDNFRATDYSFLAACAVGDTLKSFGIESLYKWPNDIMFRNKKLAGILIQTENINQINNMVIGIGLNLVSAPQYAISLSEYNIKRDDFVEKFIKSFSSYDLEYQQFGFRVIRNKWRQNCYKLNEQIILSNGVSGILRDIDDTGNLLIVDELGNIQKITVAEIL